MVLSVVGATESAGAVELDFAGEFDAALVLLLGLVVEAVGVEGTAEDETAD